MPTTETRKLSGTGIVCGLAAYGMWGMVPIYFKAISQVPPLEVLAHRIVWSIVVLAALLVWQNRLREAIRSFTSWPVLRVLLVSTLLIAINWFVFIWAVANQKILEASLGYFINPIVNVALGMLFLGERLRRATAVAVVLASAGVAIQVIIVGSFPVVALTLAFSFGFYGLLRKTAPIGAAAGLFVETALLGPVAVGFILWLAWRGENHFACGALGLDLLLAAAGLVTAIPLLFFNKAARLLPLTTMGFLQYLAPTGHFLLAVLVFGEPFELPSVMTFGCIWTGLAVYSWDQFRTRPF